MKDVIAILVVSVCIGGILAWGIFNELAIRDTCHKAGGIRVEGGCYHMTPIPDHLWRTK